MIYFWAVVAVLVIWGIARAIRWWNLPKVAQARADRAIERQKQRTARVIARRRKWHKLQNDDEFYQNVQAGVNPKRAESKHHLVCADIERGDYDNQPIPSERRWKWFRRREK